MFRVINDMSGRWLVLRDSGVTPDVYADCGTGSAGSAHAATVASALNAAGAS